ncbi:hypothetical protein Ddc_11611 [Ditylenchus destructor]|nr:hypothetical protein Ddc_11611 [Ditylenchus destructor]
MAEQSMDKIKKLKKDLDDMFKSKEKYKTKYKKMCEEAARNSNQASSSREMDTFGDTALELKCKDLERRLNESVSCFNKNQTSHERIVELLNAEIERLKNSTEANCESSSAENETDTRLTTAQLEKELFKLRDENEKLWNRLKDAKSATEENLKSKLKRAESDTAYWNDKAYKAETELDRERERTEEMESKLQDLKDQRQKDFETIELLQQKYNGEKRKVMIKEAAFRNTVKEKDEELAELKEQRERMLANLQECRDKLKQLTAENQELARQCDLQATYDSNMDAVKEELKTQRDRAYELQGQLNNANRNRDRANNLRTKKIEEDRDLLQGELDRLKHEYRAYKSTSEDAIKENGAKGEKLIQCEKMIGQLMDELAELKRKQTNDSVSIIGKKVEEIRKKSVDHAPIMIIPGFTSKQRQTGNRNLTATKIPPRERSLSPDNAAENGGPRRSRRRSRTPNRFIAGVDYRMPQGNHARKRSVTPNKAVQTAETKRPRGRPKSCQPAVKQNKSDAGTSKRSKTPNIPTSNDKSENNVVKRPRGRPRKISCASSISSEKIQVAPEKVEAQRKRKRSATPFRRSRSKSMSRNVPQ